MASKARDLSNFISVATVDASEIASNAVTADKIADAAVTHAKLHTDMNLSGKTLTFATNQISGNAIDGGVISNFTSTGIDDNSSATAVTILSDGKVGIGTTGPDAKLEVSNITANDLPFIISGGTSSLGSLPETTGMLFGYGSGAVYKKGAIIWEFTETNARGKLHFCNDSSADSANAQLSDSKMTIDSSGNVGIGTSSPDTLLHVNGQAKFEDNITLNENTPALVIPNGDFRIFTGGGEKVRITSTGILSFPSSGLAALGSSSKQTIALPNDGGITIGNGYTFANIYGTGGNLHLRANSYIANTGTPSEIILSTASAGGGSSPDVKVKEGYLSSKKGTIQTVVHQGTHYVSINPVQTWAEASSSFRVSITPKFASGTKIFGTFSIPMNPTGAANIIMAIQPWYSTDGGTTKTVLNQGGPSGVRITGSHAWFRSNNGYDGNDMQNHIVHFAHGPGATTTMTWGFYFRSEGSNTTTFCYSSGNSNIWGWTAPVYMELREVETA